MKAKLSCLTTCLDRRASCRAGRVRAAVALEVLQRPLVLLERLAPGRSASPRARPSGDLDAFATTQARLREVGRPLCLLLSLLFLLERLPLRER